MFKIFGHPMSTCTRKVLMTLAETNTPYEFTLVDFAKGEHKQKPHTDRQPFGQLPALDDDGFALYESRAMARYINEKVGGNLVPTDIKRRAEMEQWISVESANFSAHAMAFVMEHVFKAPQGAEKLKKAAERLETALGVLEARLATNTFLAGESFTIADITYMPYIEYAMMTPAKEHFAKYPHVNAWWNRISERPTWIKVARS